MNRKHLSTLAGAILSVLAAHAAQAGDYTQLAGSARIGAAEASAMSIDEIAARKFGREGHDNAQATNSGFAAASAVRSSRTARVTSLDAFAVQMINGSVSGEERQSMRGRESISSNPAARAQLVASAALDRDASAGLSLAAVAGHKFNREADGDNKAPVRE